MPTNTYVALDRVTVGTATSTVTFNSINQGYTDLIIVAQVRGTATTYLNLRFNGDTGSNYSRTTLSGNGSSAASERRSNQTWINTDYNEAIETNFNYVNTLHIMNYSNTTTNKTVLCRANNAATGTGTTVGLWRNTAAITSVSIIANNNTFDTGSTFSLYGIAAEVSSTPTTTPPVSGYGLWLDSSDPSSFTYSSGTLVSQWSDKSGNGRHFTQASTGNQPSRISNVRQNNYPVVMFNGDFLANTGYNWSNSAFTTFVVMSYSLAATNFTGVFGANFTGGGGNGTALGISSSDFFSIFKVGVAAYPYNLLPTGSNADIAVWQSAGVSGGNITASFYKNGTQASSTQSATGLSAGTGAVLGASDTGGNDITPTGDFVYMCEVLVYPSQLSNTDRTSVENYLKAKWGIA